MQAVIVDMLSKKETSIYGVTDEKDATITLKNDSASMAFAAYLKEEYIDCDLPGGNKSNIYLNSLMVHVI